jgi:hypothetical protein
MDNFCFLKEFDLCKKDDCFCEREDVVDELTQSRAMYTATLAEMFEEVEDDG